MSRSGSVFAIASLVLVIGAVVMISVSSGQAEDAPAASGVTPGGLGLAANYPGDQGIANDPSVVFTESFETGTVSDLSLNWNEISNKDSQVLAFKTDSPEGSVGKRCIQMTATKGHDTGGHLWKLLDKGYDRLYARFYVKFAPDHPFVHHFVALGGRSNSPNYPIAGAGTRPDGADWFWTYIDLHRGLYDSILPPGGWGFYSYWCEMHSWQTAEGESDGRPAPFYGNLFYPLEPVQAPRDKWQCVEIMVKLNDLGETNGEQAFWIDGKLAGYYAPGTIEGTWFKDRFQRTGEYNTDPQPFKGFRWTKSENLKINQFWLEHYLSSVFSNDYNPHDPNIPYNDNVARIYFDNIVIATEYIGPISLGETGCDFNQDGENGLADVEDLIRNSRQGSGGVRGDYNGDGRVSIADVVTLLLDIRFGHC